MRQTVLIAFFAVASYAQNLRFSDAERSIVQIAVEKPDPNSTVVSIVPYGTGFFVRDDGTIATALHVFNQAILATAENRSGRLLVRRAIRGVPGNATWSTVNLIASDASHDLAIVRMVQLDRALWDKVGGIRVLTPTPIAEVDPGILVRLVGYFGSDVLPTTLVGHLAGASLFTISPTQNVEEFLVSALAVPGHSGSPVLLEDGTVLGVAISIVPVTLPLTTQPQPQHSGIIRATKAEHLQRLMSSLPPTATIPAPSK